MRLPIGVRLGLGVLGVELFGNLFCRAFAGGGVDVHRCCYIGVAKSVLEVLGVYILFNGYRGVAVAELMRGAGDSNRV